MSVRRFLKKVGITAQGEIENTVREALSKGSLIGKEKLPIKGTLSLSQGQPELDSRWRDRARIVLSRRTGQMLLFASLARRSMWTPRVCCCEPKGRAVQIQRRAGGRARGPAATRSGASPGFHIMQRDEVDDTAGGMPPDCDLAAPPPSAIAAACRVRCTGCESPVTSATELLSIAR
jgi:Family of unknown function (DUF6494)